MEERNNNSSVFLLLLMLALAFFLFRPNKPNNQNYNTETQQTSNVASEQNVYAEMPDDAAASLSSIVKAHGVKDASKEGAYKLVNNTVSLTTVPADSVNPVEGIIKVGNSDINVKDILNDNLADLTPEQASQARKALTQLITTYGRYKSFAPFFYGDNKKHEIKTEKMTITFASKGGVIEKVVLNKYLNENNEPPTDVVLFDGATGGYGFTFNTADQRICTDSLYFNIKEESDTSVVMSLPLGKGIDWSIRYAVVPNEYIVKMEILQNGISAVIPPSTSSLNFSWWQKMGRNEVGRTFEERNSSVAYKYLGNGPKELGFDKAKDEDLNSRVKWVAFKNQFFSSVIIARTSFSSAQISSSPLKKDPNFVKDMSMKASIAYNQNDGCPAAFDFFFGPNSYPLLSSLDKKIDNGGDDLELNRLVPLGWSLFRWINQLIVIPVFTFLSKYISSYGIIILLLTIFIKLIIFPFTWKSYMSQAKMRVLAPEIKEINDKYPGDENAMKRQQETMALYSRVGASPFSGCLPMLLQMPVLIAMFSFFPSAIELRGQSFLWAHNLAAPDYICKLPFTIPFYGNHVSLFCLLMTVTNILYTRITMQNQVGTAQPAAMKWMTYLMPVMFLFWFNDYASGLSYYYFLSLLITIVQTWAFRKCINEEKVRKELMENAKKPKKKSGFMARMEQLQKQQEAMLREQAKQNAKRRK